MVEGTLRFDIDLNPYTIIIIIIIMVIEPPWQAPTCPGCQTTKLQTTSTNLCQASIRIDEGGSDDLRLLRRPPGGDLVY